VLRLHGALVAGTLAEAGLTEAAPRSSPPETAGWQDAIGGVL